jgi:hypothetical protein
MLGLFLDMISTRLEHSSTELQDADIGWPVLLSASNHSSASDFDRVESGSFPPEEP